MSEPARSRHEDEISSLTAQISFLDEEITVLRRRLADSPRQLRLLEERLRETEASLSAVSSQNERLASTLREARDQIIALKEEVDRLAKPPSGFGVFLGANEDGSADVFTSGRKMRVQLSPLAEVGDLRPGQEVVLNEALNIVAAHDYESVGEVVTLREPLGDGRALVSQANVDRVVKLAEPLRAQALQAGDLLLLAPQSGYAYEQLPDAMARAYSLEEVPNISYSDIGGLTKQIEQIRDAIELPYLCRDMYRRIALRPPKGVLLYGPPGCGKTLIAKAVASSLARQVVTADPGTAEAKSFFINIKGPELLNMYVGETERQIRLVFQRAREKASEGMPVIMFFDEMDALFRTRGAAHSAHVESTVVPQLLTEIDGVESLEDVIIIGATNRDDLIDPAILRPGRLDIKIKIDRPDDLAASDILARYLVPALPLHPGELAEFQGSPEAVIASMIRRTVDHLYAEEERNKFLEVTYESGAKETIYFRDFCSGAVLNNVVDKAKQAAIKRARADGLLGLKTDDLVRAAAQEILEIEDLNATANPDDWARISGKKGERIVFIRTLRRHGTTFAGRSIRLEQ